MHAPNFIDIGFSAKKIESEWISSRKLSSEKIFLISKDKIDPTRLEKYCWIGVAKTEYLQRLTKHKRSNRIIQAESLNLLLKLVQSGLGIAAVAENLIPDNGVKSYPTNLIGEAIYLNLPTYQQLPKHLKQFLDRFS